MSPGLVRSATIDEPIVPHNSRIKHTETLEIDPINLSFGSGVSPEIIRWIAGTVNKIHFRRSGELLFLNGTKTQSSLEMLDVVILEVAIPAFDSTR